MKRRSPKGFTLIELGIVIGIAIFLAVAVVATLTGSIQAARVQRTGDELVTLSRAAVVAIKRGLTSTVAGTWQFRTTGTLTVPVTNVAPICYDLTRAAGRVANCPGINAPGPTWSAAYAPAGQLPAGSPILEALGGSTLTANGGYNPWCLPYVVCIYPSRAEVLTCVPSNDVDANGLESVMRCGPCGTPVPATSEATSCVLRSVSPFSQALPAAKMSYLPDEPGIDPARTLILGPFNPAPRSTF